MNDTPLPLRDDTFFGVCEGLGEDLGIPSNLLRLALSLMLFWNPAAAVATYFAAGVLVLFTRLVFPKPRIAAADEAAPVQVEPAVQEPAEAAPVPLAA